MSFLECIKIITCGCFGVLEPNNNQQNIRKCITYTFAIKNNDSESESDEEQWVPPTNFCNSSFKEHVSPQSSPGNIQMSILNSSSFPETSLMQRRSPSTSPAMSSPPLSPIKSELNISPSSNSSWEVLDEDKIEIVVD